LNRRAALSSLAILTAGVVASACRKTPELPVLGQLGDFSLTSESGKTVGSAELRGQVWVAAFMFTRCPTVCPRITRRMRDLQVSARAKGLPLRLVSFTVDPENDTPEVLRRYAAEYGADVASWSFLTGSYESVKTTSVDGFKMALEGKPDSGADHYGILHGSHLVLVDRELKIRGYYRTSDDAEMARLFEDSARV
jgi:protein SCO1